MFPDGCFDIVIYIRQRERNNVFLTGIWDRPVMVSTPPDSSIVGVRFYPVAVDLFLKTSLAELKNLSCPLLPEMLHEPADLPLEFIFTEKNPITLITFIKEYLFLRLQVSRNLHESYFSWLLNADFSRSVSALSRELG